MRHGSSWAPSPARCTAPGSGDVPTAPHGTWDTQALSRAQRPPSAPRTRAPGPPFSNRELPSFCFPWAPQDSPAAPRSVRGHLPRLPWKPRWPQAWEGRARLPVPFLQWPWALAPAEPLRDADRPLKVAQTLRCRQGRQKPQPRAGPSGASAVLPGGPAGCVRGDAGRLTSEPCCSSNL